MKNMIDEKTIIKHLDIIFKNISDIGKFNLSRILSKGIGFDFNNSSEKDKLWYNNLHDAVLNFAKAHKYIKSIEDGFFVYCLSEKGIKAKELGGHLKYQKFIKKNPLTLYQKIYLTFFICFGLFGIYKIVQPTVSVSEFDKLKNDFDSLKTEFDSNKKLNSKPTLELSNDTLRTKNQTD